MKKGKKGRQGCCGCCGIWGVSINCPNPERSEHGDVQSADPGDSPHLLEDPAARNLTTSRGFPYNARNWTNVFGNPAHKEILPDVWPQDDPPTGHTWYAFAAKLPTSNPHGACEKYGAISSAEDGGDGTWQGALGPILKIEEYESGDPDDPVKVIGCVGSFGFVLRSRAIYIDGRQSHVAFSTLGNYPANVSGHIGGEIAGTGVPYAGTFISYNPHRPSQNVWGDTHIFPLGNPVNVAGRDGDDRWFTATLDGNVIIPSGIIGAGATVMEAQFQGLDDRIDNILSLDNDLENNKQYPANAIFLGEKYLGLSAYNPTTLCGWDSPWALGRLKYDDQRPPFPAGPLEPGIFAFVTYSGVGGHSADLGNPATEYAGDYIVALFSLREYRDSSAMIDENPDSPHVICFHKSTFLTGDDQGTKILATNGLAWNSKAYRPGVGDADTMSDGYGDGTAIADGTISDAESEVGEVIMDAENPPDDYPDETFPNPKIWCYNRVWDSVEKKNVNLALMTTEPDAPTTTVSGVIADFEQVDDMDPDEDYLDGGLPDGVAFTTYGTGFEENKWISSTRGIVGDDVAYTGDGGTHSAWADNSLTNEGTTELQITVHVATAGDLKFKYRVGNRVNGSHDGVTFAIDNIPNPDNYLALFDNGVQIQKFDMVNYPVDATGDGPAFETWYDYTLPLAAGTHNLRWSVVRTTQYDELFVQLDHIEFPELMPGDDINGRTRWYYDGYELRKLTDWAWAVRDDETDTPTAIAGRGATEPHCITMDGKGRCLIGNPQYVMRRNRDGTLDVSHGKSRGPGFVGEDGGWVHFSASPNIVEPDPPCVDPDNRVIVDQVQDARWGGFQILSASQNGDAYQVRGANGDLGRDTTHFPFDKKLWNYKHPITGEINQEIFSTIGAKVSSGGIWADRVHSWTVSDDGKTLEPHIQVIWRPIMHQPAWPGEGGTTDEERFPHPPYRSDFATSTTSTDWAPQSVRWRDPRQLTLDRTLMLETTISTILSMDGSGSQFRISSGVVDSNYYFGMLVEMPDDPHFYRITTSGDPGGGLELLIEADALNPSSADEGDAIKIWKYDPAPPQWSQTNFLVPTTYSDALSRIPQPLWVRNVNDGPSDPDTQGYWDPDSDEATIAASTDDPLPWGGPMGSASWVLVQGRFIATGSRFMSYVFNFSTDDVCTGHGPDDEDAGPGPLLADIQRPILPLSAMTDFDVVPCDCGCC